MEKWVVCTKKADFYGIAEKFKINPVIARLIRNRDVIGDEKIQEYLHGTLADLPSGRKMKDLERLQKSWKRRYRKAAE